MQRARHASSSLDETQATLKAFAVESPWFDVVRYVKQFPVHVKQAPAFGRPAENECPSLCKLFFK